MDAESSKTTLGAAHAPLTTLIARAIRERILTGELAPGDRLVEARLSEELGVSRVPVREALRALAADGVVTIEPRRGASVTSYSDEHIQELVEVRATLESLNAKLAARRNDPERIARLQQIVAAGALVARSDDLGKLQEDNVNFHEALAGVAANSVLRDLVRSLRERTAPIFAPHSRKRARENWEEHAAIVRAVIAGDAELAGLLAARHVYNAAQVVPHAAPLQQAGAPAGFDGTTAPRARAKTKAKGKAASPRAATNPRPAPAARKATVAVPKTRSRRR
jgi:DNA-binding GntR family transcriptional regulator